MPIRSDETIEALSSVGGQVRDDDVCSTVSDIARYLRGRKLTSMQDICVIRAMVAKLLEKKMRDVIRSETIFRLEMTPVGLQAYSSDEGEEVCPPAPTRDLNSQHAVVEVRFLRVTGGVEVQIPDRRSKVKDALITMTFKTPAGRTLDDAYASAKAWAGNRLAAIATDERRAAEEKAISERWPAEMIVEYTLDGVEITKAP